jgi:mRNA interferase MazF
MKVERGDVFLADLNPIRGSEQAGIRPVLIFQHNRVNKASRTVITIPFTTNLNRAVLPTCAQVAQEEGGLTQESVALCHQLRVLDKTRLTRKLGTVSDDTMTAVERVVLFTLGIV